ncbi:hypothetical protein B0H11DRAFT_2234474 [Mycena galericulata]|nr:hypothetical protein B0H11DRAFT_2234474 [Mycena galericulata]
MARNDTNKENETPPGITVLAPAGAQPEKQRAIWNAATRAAILLDTLGTQKAEGDQTDNTSWKSDAWTACAEALKGTEKGANGSGGPRKMVKMCSTRWSAEKVDYLQVKGLRNTSGAGWNEVDHLVVLEDSVWEEISQCPPKTSWMAFKRYTNQLR